KNGEVEYSLLPSTGWERFHIDSKTGQLTNTEVLDREEQESYVLTVYARDGGTPQRDATATVRVTVTDINDHAPVFAGSCYDVAAPENVRLPSLHTFRAHDADTGDNARITYSLAGVVLVYVEPWEAAAATVAFTRDGNYTAIVAENAAPGTPVLQARASVRGGALVQQPPAIEYALVAGNDDAAFTIHPTTGHIIVRSSQRLDRELTPRRHLVVEASAGAAGVSYAHVQVALEDENDNAPYFVAEHVRASVYEGSLKGTFVAKLVAYDADDGRNAATTYHIVGGNDDSAFRVDAATGVVTTSIQLDREIRPSYSLAVAAVDVAPPRGRAVARLYVTVLDRNDNQPTFPPQGRVRIQEDAPVGTTVAVATANDVDIYPNLTYALVRAAAAAGTRRSLSTATRAS
ncbi:PREDICTED: protocadherin-16-like, partial [Priapulus caudatus]|uniref:Protocadherin-16-like n=1 Tax=Priapulus caudatus TaxID=37621 RepID=A0ABM1EUS4_PRICU